MTTKALARPLDAASVLLGAVLFVALIVSAWAIDKLQGGGW